MNVQRGNLLTAARGLLEQGRYEETVALAQAGLMYDPPFSPVRVELARAQAFLGWFDDALATLDLVSPSDPMFVNAAAMRALTLFYKGDWQAAWKAFEVRFALMDKAPSVTRYTQTGAAEPLPPWNGQKPPQSLLLLGEQGMGDNIQFAAFAARLAAAGTRVVFTTQPRLFRLLSTAHPGIEFVDSTGRGQVSDIECWCPLMSLPGRMRLAPPALKMEGPYLAADPARIERWRKHIGPEGFRIGIAWQGNRAHTGDGQRSAPLHAFAALAELPGVRLISLQKGDGVEQIDDVAFGNRIEKMPADFDEGTDAFVDTAAIMASLDLVVTVDTAIVHLAGALGVRTCLLLAHRGTDWRWSYSGDDSLWYASVRLYRQSRRGNWEDVLQRLAHELRAELSLPVTGGKMMPLVPVSVGELVDKITILRLKLRNMTDRDKKRHVSRELEALLDIRWSLELESAVEVLENELADVNARLWAIEDSIREQEQASSFGDDFIALARDVYLWNDRRAEIKRRINQLTSSEIVEEKHYKSTSPDTLERQGPPDTPLRRVKVS